jgi:regulator of protease activity HflC (stomatin/prohibitin superfamily)
MKKIIKPLLMALLPLFLFSGCYVTTVDSKEVGVLKNLGEVQKEVKTAGFVMDLIPFNDIVKMKISNKLHLKK